MPRTEHWLQIENHPWDLSPNGLNRLTDEQFTRGANGLFRSLPADALIIRRYTPNWAAPDDHPLNPWDLNEPDPAKTQGTIPGATIEGKVGDEIIVHFRNMDQRPGLSARARTHSFYVHGLQHTNPNDGTYPFSTPDPAQGNKQGDRVAPGDSFDYRFTLPHASNAGVWLYHDASVSRAASVALGAFGAIIIRAGGEMKSNLPPGPLHTSADTPLSFAAVPQPPPSGEHLFFYHELAGAGECLNGRQFLGNTPTVLGRLNTRIKYRVLNFTGRVQTIHLHGHRWVRANGWTDTETIGIGAGWTFEVLEGSAESGGGAGEWAITANQSDSTMSSLVITDGGALTLQSGVPAPGPALPPDERGI